MDKQTIFDLWAPPNSIWSAWVKPVLFAHLRESLLTIPPLPTPHLNWLPPVEEGWAIVVDLSGMQSVGVGLALAQKGYRPVPLFNSCPLPTAFINEQQLPLEKLLRFTKVDVESILAALVQGCSVLNQIDLPNDAPPAFLLDDRRQGQSLNFGIVPNNLFDNRSIVFSTDFPSVDFLRAQNIRGVIVFRERDRKFSSDLTHILQIWQKAGMLLSYKCLANQRPPQRLKIWAFPWLGLWIRLLTRLNLIQNSTGGFGGFISSSSS
ncbi:hypothetical protein HW132_20430 [Brasilonema sp. CT11]|nr:hypothetical protein [Brasilonema sp. CT11]